MLENEKIVLFALAFNEEKLVSNIAKDGLELLRRGSVQEFFVLNDGSTDSTKEICERLGARVVSAERNLGKGDAFLLALSEAKRLGATTVIMTDSDMLPGSHFSQTHMDELHKSLESESGEVGMFIFDSRGSCSYANRNLSGFRAIKMPALDFLFELTPSGFCLKRSDEQAAAFIEACQGFGLETALNEFVRWAYVDLSADLLLLRPACEGPKGKDIASDIFTAETIIANHKGTQTPSEMLREIAKKARGDAHAVAARRPVLKQRL